VIVHWLVATDVCIATPKVARATLTIVVVQRRCQQAEDDDPDQPPAWPR